MFDAISIFIFILVSTTLTFSGIWTTSFATFVSIFSLLSWFKLTSILSKLTSGFSLLAFIKLISVFCSKLVSTFVSIGICSVAVFSTLILLISIFVSSLELLLTFLSISSSVNFVKPEFSSPKGISIWLVTSLAVIYNIILIFWFSPLTFILWSLRTLSINSNPSSAVLTWAKTLSKADKPKTDNSRVNTFFSGVSIERIIEVPSTMVWKMYCFSPCFSWYLWDIFFDI